MELICRAWVERGIADARRLADRGAASSSAHVRRLEATVGHYYLHAQELTEPERCDCPRGVSEAGGAFPLVSFIENGKRRETMPYKIKISKMDSEAIRGISDCLIPISLTHPKQKGEHLRAILSWAEERFENICVDIGGTLSRHNIPGPRDAARRMAFEMERSWIDENAAYMNRHPIIRWNERLAHHGMRGCLRENFRRYRHDPAFRQAIDQDVDRLRMKHPEVPEHQSRFYLLEEWTVDALHTHRLTAFLYPGNPLSCYRMQQNLYCVEYRHR